MNNCESNQISYALIVSGMYMCANKCQMKSEMYNQFDGALKLSKKLN